MAELQADTAWAREGEPTGRELGSGFLVIAVGPDTAMQLHILSDPHIEFEAFYPPAVETTYVCVFHEIATADPDASGASDVRTAPWIRRRPVVNRPLAASLRLELDPGEAEAIACAVEANAKLLLIDEHRGRLVLAPGLGDYWLDGGMLPARNQGLIELIRPLLDPRGYPTEPNPASVADFTVEV
jgi:predicted nucleic acid-binding protein